MPFGVVGGLLGAAITAGSNAAIANTNNQAAAEREAIARSENYMYNEKAARMADARTRALYNDLYSPSAQLQQLKDAGLSPSLFYGDGGGISGQTGAQGAGAAGVGAQSFGMPPVDFTQIAKTIAETDLIKAQTKKTNSDTIFQDLENEVKELENAQYKTEFSLLNTKFLIGGKETSLFELAENCYTYDKFLDNVREVANDSSNVELRDATTSEAGQKILRGIYEANSKLSSDIAVLSAEKMDAEFYKQVTRELQKQDFAQLNAQDAIQRLRNTIATNTLESKQHEAWNRVLDKLGNGSTTQDIVIVLGMILNNALSNYRMPPVNSNNRTFNFNQR